MAKAKQTGQKQSRWIFRLLSRTAIVAAIVGCTVSVVSIQSSIAEKKTELAQVQKQIDSLTAENEDLKRVLESGDIDSYMEQLAREDYNYAYPDEYRFYDTSRN
jgi:cell division protein FtsB